MQRFHAMLVSGSVTILLFLVLVIILYNIEHVKSVYSRVFDSINKQSISNVFTRKRTYGIIVIVFVLTILPAILKFPETIKIVCLVVGLTSLLLIGILRIIAIRYKGDVRNKELREWYSFLS